MAIAEIIFGLKPPNCVDLKFWAKSIPISSNVRAAKSLKRAKNRSEAEVAINPANKTVVQQLKAKVVETNPASKTVAQPIKARVKAKVVVATTPEETKTATIAAVVKIGAATTAIAPTMVANPTIQTGKTAVHKLKVVVAPILPATPYQKLKRKNANANAKKLLLAKKAKVVAVKANKVRVKPKAETTAVATTAEAVAAKVNVHTHKVAAVAITTTTIITTTIDAHSNAHTHKAVAVEIVLPLKKTMARYHSAKLKKKSRQPWPVFPVEERKSARSCNGTNGIASANARKSWNKKPKAANCR